jgi:hypothetical protein
MIRKINKLFENVARLKYFGTKLPDQNSTAEEQIRGAVVTIFCLPICLRMSRLKYTKTINLSAVLCMCDTASHVKGKTQVEDVEEQGA